MFWKNFLVQSFLVFAYILLSLAANLWRHVRFIDFGSMVDNRLLFMIHLVIFFMIFGVKLLEYVVARCVVFREGRRFGAALVVLVIGVLNALVCWGLMLLWIELSAVIFVLAVLHYFGINWFSLVKFVYVFLLFQLLSLGYNSYDFGERVSLGIPFVYWLDLISNGEVIYCILRWDKLVINQILLFICCMIVRHALGSMVINTRLSSKFAGVGVIVLIAYFIEVLLLASQRLFEGRALDYSCDCYGFPLGFVMRCNYFDQIMFHRSSLVFSVVWHIALFAGICLAIVCRMYMWVRLVLLSMWFYLLYGTTHVCGTYMLGYLGYMNPSIFFRIDDMNMHIDFISVMADFACTFALLFVYLIELRTCSCCSEAQRTLVEKTERDEFYPQA